MLVLQVIKKSGGCSVCHSRKQLKVFSKTVDTFSFNLDIKLSQQNRDRIERWLKASVVIPVNDGFYWGGKGEVGSRALSTDGRAHLSLQVQMAQ